jgi:penicillin-binding protein 2
VALLVSDHRREESVPHDRLLRDDPTTASSKVAIFQYLTVAVFVFLVSGFWKLQVQSPDVYSEAAERNRIKSIPILAPRGKILDRDGRVIVDNKASYSLLLNRDQIKPEHLPAIAGALDLDYGELVTKIRRMGSNPQIIIKDQLTRDEIAWVESHRDDSAYPEMQLIKAWRRQYPQDGFAAHVVGYVGEISESELSSPAFLDYQQGEIIGKDGLERQYDLQLRGVDGQQRVLVDNMGRERQMEGTQDAVPGKDLHTTLDLDLQAVAELAMEGKRGAVVALDPRSGEILAMVSRPTFDPNKFTGRISRDDWNAINGDPHKPLLNRAIQAELAPGSTFKPFTALAGLETGTIDPTTQFHCPGGASFYGHYFGCWRHGGHGTVALHHAIEQSCDVYFYNVANKVGIDNLAHYAELGGFGHKTGVDLPNERESTMPSTKWKMRMFRQKWYAGETISVGIGQGAITASPLELAAAEGGLAIGGHWFAPHLLSDTRPKILREGHLNPDNVREIVSGMYDVVNGNGTAHGAIIPGLRVCGKTGSAQVASNKFTKGRTAEDLKDNAWFVGYAPQDAPEIVVVALFENGVHGSFAAPIARDVIKAYFDKKARLGKYKTESAYAPRRLLNGPAKPLAMLSVPVREGLPQ